MSDTERVRAWRQRLKDSGLVPMTIWVKADTKARYEDLALQSHHSASELAQLALDAYRDRKSTRLNSSHSQISYAVFCLKKKNNKETPRNDEERHVDARD